MTALLIAGEQATRFRRNDLSAGFSEGWLQNLLFGHPDLIPMAGIDPAAGSFIPVCRELPLPKPGGVVYLDLFGVTPTGRPVLIECKLWRNPQARREVVAQILEYAALLRRWSYADLTARLKSRLVWEGENPLYRHVAGQGVALGEAEFTDAVSRNLRNGDFHLVVIGDGIREDASAIAEHIADSGARFALVELQRWTDGRGSELLVPLIPFRTEIVRQRVLVDAQGWAVQVEAEDEASDDEVGEGPDPEKSAAREANRAFWQSFIDRARFDHPEQPPPRHGGNNWVRIPLPSPARYLTAYRYQGRAGMYVVEERGSDLVARLVADAPDWAQGLGAGDLRLHAMGRPDEPSVSLDQPEDVKDQMGWLLDMANRMVNVLRPKLSEYSSRRS